MYQFEEAQPEEEQQQPLHHLEHSNHGQASMVGARRHQFKRLSQMAMPEGGGRLA
jgi:HPt (histidine-containing phosphotransfer) domain-containing protein